VGIDTAAVGIVGSTDDSEAIADKINAENDKPPRRRRRDPGKKSTPRLRGIAPTPEALEKALTRGGLVEIIPPLRSSPSDQR